MLAWAGGASADTDAPPLTPDADEARRWAEQELSDRAYEIAQPTPFDRAARAVGDFFANIFNAQLSGGWGSAFAVIAAIVVIVLIVVAFAIWGRPRATRRSHAAATTLFGEAEGRSAAELRRDAASHAAREEWDAAVVLRFRALARGLDERGIVDAPPGATVHSFARAAGRRLPAARDGLDAAATAFDDVRYLRRPGTADLYHRVVDIDEAVSVQHPTQDVALAVSR
ncbi:DUF4129 domain-containing protein [uncultured Microbacterium sp.]|uniref:DUF4129 domain-containing protein n=1 Tax=uncultured Microbacterium sp. TaxID=191216 RepID=UPI0035CA6BAA